MRELKFRAWNPYTKTMLQPATPFELATGIITWPSQAYDHVMQYTVLKDKNGVEIYEGDIVQPYPDESVFDRPEPQIVSWDEERCELGITTNRRSCLVLCKSSQDTIEVIGNIYENPELLEK